MLTFRLDETNFAEGDREGIRIVLEAGLKVDFDEFATDADTLGLWHLHNGACQGEGTGLEDASGAGRDFVNHGAAANEDGYRLVRHEADYMAASVGSFEDPQSAVTVETWVRDWQVPVGSWGVIARYYGPSDQRLAIWARRDGAASKISIEAVTGGGAAAAIWTGSEVEALLEGPDAWHVAAVLDAPSSLRLFVNGVQRAQDTTEVPSLPAGSYTFRLGHPASGFAIGSVVDEVRLSSAARYTSDFTPYRLLASGTYTSPTFDAVRTQADWADFVSEQATPSGTAIAWEVRAADETDAFGHPQTPWQSYSGDPGTLPDGRYFQWRSTLSPSADRTTSPTLESIEVHASEAGYDLYLATGPDPDALDYATPWARVGPGVTQIETDALDPGAVHWFGTRPVNAGGVESPVTQCEARVELDASGAAVSDRPAGVLTLDAAPGLLGVPKLSWRYRVGGLGVVPECFRIFGDGGTGTIDYETPLGQVPYQDGRDRYDWTSGPLAEGVEHQLAVRAVTAGEVMDEQPAVASVVPDATPPGSVDALEAEVAL